MGSASPAGRRRCSEAGRPSLPTTQGFSDSFGPLAARVYVIPPQGW